VIGTTHPSLPTLSLQKGSRNPGGLKAADTCTGLVLNALQFRAQWKRDILTVTRRKYVTTNRFDIDRFLSMWCYINRKAALHMKEVRIAAAMHGACSSGYHHHLGHRLSSFVKNKPSGALPNDLTFTLHYSLHGSQQLGQPCAERSKATEGC